MENTKKEQILSDMVAAIYPHLPNKINNNAHANHIAERIALTLLEEGLLSSLPSMEERKTAEEFWSDIAAKYFLHIASGELPQLSFNESNVIFDWFKIFLSQQTEAMAKELSEAKKEIESYQSLLDDASKEVINLQSELSAMRERVEKQQWISVKNEKPEYYKDVIVWSKTRGMFMGFHRLSDEENEYYGSVHYEIVLENVTHWMPLPEPPQSINPTKQD